MIENIKAWIRSHFFTKTELVDQGALDSRYYTEAETSALIAGTWTALTLNTGGNWADVGAGQQTARYKKVGDLVFVQGFVVRTSGANATVLTMPSGARPPAIVNVIVTGDDAYARITFNTDGTVVLNAGTAVNFLQLNNICFSTI